MIGDYWLEQIDFRMEKIDIRKKNILKMRNIGRFCKTLQTKKINNERINRNNRKDMNILETLKSIWKTKKTRK